MQRTEALSILRLKTLPSTGQKLNQTIQITNPQLDGWGNQELEAYRQPWQLLSPADATRRQAA